MPGVKVAEELGEGGTGTLDRLGATGVGAQDGRDTDLDGHERRSWVSASPANAGGGSSLVPPTGLPGGSFRGQWVRRAFTSKVAGARRRFVPAVTARGGVCRATRRGGRFRSANSTAR